MCRRSSMSFSWDTSPSIAAGLLAQQPALLRLELGVADLTRVALGGQVLDHGKVVLLGRGDAASEAARLGDVQARLAEGAEDRLLQAGHRAGVHGLALLVGVDAVLSQDLLDVLAGAGAAQVDRLAALGLAHLDV